MLAIEIIIVFFGFLYIMYQIGGGKENEVGGFSLVFATLLIIFVPYLVYKLTNNALIVLALFIIVPLVAAYYPSNPQKEQKKANDRAFGVLRWFNGNGYNLKLKHAQFLVNHFQSPINTKISPNLRDTYTWLYENIYYEYKRIMDINGVEKILGVKFDDYAKEKYNNDTRFKELVIGKVMLAEGLKKPPLLRLGLIIPNFYEELYDKHTFPRNS